MSYGVSLHRSAQKELGHLPEQIFKPIDAAIWALRSNPRLFGVKKLQGDLHRIRIGSWRIIYAILDKERRVVVLRIAKRDERTYHRLSGLI